MLRTFKRLAGSNTSKRSGRAMFAFLARSLQQISTLAIMLVSATFLDAAEFGVYSLGIIFMMLVQAMTYTGFFHFTITSNAPDDEVLSTSFWLIIGLATAASVLLAVLAYPIAWVFSADELGPVTLLLALSQPGASFLAWASAALMRQGRVNVNFQVMFWQNLASLIGGVAMLWYWQSIYALVAYQYMRVGLGFVMYVLVGVKFPGFKYSKELARIAISFSGGLYGSRALNFFSKYAADLLLGLFYTPTDVGLYRFGNRVATGITESFVQPMGNFAIASFGAIARTTREFERPLEQYMGAMGLMTGMLSAIIIVYAEEALIYLFPAYVGALMVTYAMALRGVVGMGRWMMEPVFSGFGETKWVMQCNLVAAVTSLVAVFAAFPLGLEGMAWSQAVVNVGHTIFALYLMQTKAGLRVGRAVRLFLIGILLAAVYGGVLEIIWLVVLSQSSLAPLTMLVCGGISAAVLAPVFLAIGVRLNVFTLDIFAG